MAQRWKHSKYEKITLDFVGNSGFEKQIIEKYGVLPYFLLLLLLNFESELIRLLTNSFPNNDSFLTFGNGSDICFGESTVGEILFKVVCASTLASRYNLNSMQDKFK